MSDARNIDAENLHAELLALKEATRVRISAGALEDLRGDVEAMEIMAHTKRERRVAGAFRILLEMYDRVAAL